MSTKTLVPHMMTTQALQDALHGVRETLAKKIAKRDLHHGEMERLKMPVYVPDNTPRMISIREVHPLSDLLYDGASLLDIKKALQGVSDESLEGFFLDYTYDEYKQCEVRAFKGELRLETRQEVKERNQQMSTRHYNRAGHTLERQRQRLEDLISHLNRQLVGVRAQITLLEAELATRKALPINPLETL